MSKVEDLVLILAKKFGYLEKRVTYLEGKCRGQQSLIEKLRKKSRKVGKRAKSQGKLIISKVLEDSAVDLKPDVDLIQISKSNENLKGNLERCAKNDKKLNQKPFVQMGVRCEKNLSILNTIREIERKAKIFQRETDPESNQQQDEKNLEIPSKSKEFTNLSDRMRVHTEEIHYKCKICSKVYSSLGNLKRHNLIHTGEKPFSCSFCSKSFNRKYYQSQHIKTHTGERPYSCTFCSKTFARYDTRKTHIRTHTGEKPFSCSFCSKSFAHKGSLNDHLKTHTGEKPHSCSICSKSFAVLQYLKDHLRIHTGEKPYSCSVCAKTFRVASSFRLHKKLKHPKM